MTTAAQQARASQLIVAKMRRILGGQPPGVQGAAIADMLSIFIVGHHPALREQMLEQTVALARQLIEPNEKMIFPDGLPEGWGTN